MYFTIEWPKQLRSLEEGSLCPILRIRSNRDRILFAVLTSDALSLWFCKPPVELLHLRRSRQSVTEIGANQLVEWRQDSSTIAVSTDRGHVLFYRVESDVSVGQPYLYVQTENGRHTQRRDESNVHVGAGIPAIALTQTAATQVFGGVKCLVSMRDELMVATANGAIQRFRWDGSIIKEMTLALSSIPLSVDLQHSRASPIASDDVYIIAMEYSNQMGGFAAVLCDGRAAFITSTSSRFHPLHIMGVWATQIRNATCVAVNHRYRLVAFGCQNGEGHVFSIDEVTGALILSHSLSVSSKDYPDAAQCTGCVSVLTWSPDGCALAMAWQHGGYSLWSVFGALLICTLSSDQRMTCNASGATIAITSMEWGMEGYHLWAVPHDPGGGILQIQFVKSAMAANPCMGNHEHLFLQGEDRVYINTHVQPPGLNPGFSTDLLKSFQGDNVAPGNDNACSAIIMNKQLEVLQIPHNYIAINWPIRCCAVDRSGTCIAVAGKTGLCHYAAFSKRWKLFGNESQEHDMAVRGGMTWWKDFICAACFDINEQRDEIRFYPRGAKLDNTFSQSIRLSSQVLLVNVFRDMLIVFGADLRITLYDLTRRNTHSAVCVDIVKLQEVAIDSFIPLASSVIAITLTSMRIETGHAARNQMNSSEAESILLNYAGKLLMFQREKAHVGYHNNSDAKGKPLPFTAPVMVASNVECVWSSGQATPDKPYLMDALWLSCGSQSMKVWLPLLPRDESRTPAYMSKRIMLPFSVNIYPLCISFEEAIVLGVSNDYSTYQSVPGFIDVPYSTLEKATQIYLHHILRQLLRRNLGTHAVDMARCCTELIHFSHTLELLLHEVLEEEATSKEPIPDPLLPRVVAFIHEFPQHLQTIVHCARKTEVALWPYLFSSAGDPKELFEECLMSGDLDTAAFYLIILQNLEKANVSQQQATLLLGAALDHCKWELARDLVRFLSIMGICEAEQELSPATHRSSAPQHGAYHAQLLHTPPISPSESSQFAYSKHRKEMEQDGMNKRVRRASCGRLPQSTHDGANAAQERRPSKTDRAYIDHVLSDYARKLLRSYRVYDLGRFSANLDDYHLITWLKRESVHAAKVLDFVTALKQLHLQFHWPFPLLCNNFKHSSPLSSTSSLDVCSPPPPYVLPKPADFSVTLKPYADIGQLNLMDMPNELGEGFSVGDYPMSANVVLRPQTLSIQLRGTDDSSLATTELSENSSMLGDADVVFDQSSWVEVSPQNGLDQLTHEFANKGPSQSEIELRYLYQIFLEAGCLEWALLIAIVLRDNMAVVRTANTASMTDTPIEMVGRMREGLSFLQLWAETECAGYRPFLSVIRCQAAVLDKIVEMHAPEPRLASSQATPAQTTHKRSESVGSAHGHLTSSSESSLKFKAASPCSSLAGDGSDNESFDDLAESSPSAVKPGYDCAIT